MRASGRADAGADAGSAPPPVPALPPPTSPRYLSRLSIAANHHCPRRHRIRHTAPPTGTTTPPLASDVSRARPSASAVVLGAIPVASPAAHAAARPAAVA